jgi:hypothetical protein
MPLDEKKKKTSFNSIKVKCVSSIIWEQTSWHLRESFHLTEYVTDRKKIVSGQAKEDWGVVSD